MFTVQILNLGLPRAYLPGYLLSHPLRSRASTINGISSDIAPSTLGNWSPDCCQQIGLSDSENANEGSKTESATSADASQVDVLDTVQMRSLSSSWLNLKLRENTR